jgi:hypothetical protein
MRDAKERREAERKDKEAQRAMELRNARECDKQKPGYQRLRILQYDDMRRKLVSSHGTKLGRGEVRGMALTSGHVAAICHCRAGAGNVALR